MTSAARKLLQRLREYTARNEGIVCGAFELRSPDEETDIDYINGDAAKANQFRIFGRDADGSLYAIWCRDGTGEDQSPSVYLDSEFDMDHLSILSPDFESSLLVLALGFWEQGKALYWEVSADDEHDCDSNNTPAFRKWLKDELGIDVGDDQKALIRRCQERLKTVRESLHQHFLAAVGAD